MSYRRWNFPTKFWTSSKKQRKSIFYSRLLDPNSMLRLWFHFSEVAKKKRGETCIEIKLKNSDFFDLIRDRKEKREKRRKQKNVT